MNSRIIEFKNNRNIILRGIYHIPSNISSGRKKILIIFPNGGLIGCEGDYRAYVNISRILCENGFYIFRFSPSGFGNSDGFIPDCQRAELSTKIETGFLIDDIESAAIYAKNEFTPDSIVLSGICGGAISVFLTAAKLRNIKHVIPISLPLILDNQVEANIYTQRMQKEEAVDFLRAIFSKVFSIKSWMRFFSFKSDITSTTRAIWRALPWTNVRKQYEGDNATFQINKKFEEASKIIIESDQKVLFIFGMMDRVWWEFKNYYLCKFIKEKTNLPFEVTTVEKANHMFTMYEMQIELASIITNWLNKFPELSFK